jgi:N-acetylglucosamine kinase-like BadF-type ATPase
MRYFLGLDGGGSRTTAWLADERGRVVARSSSGPSNPLKVGFATSKRELKLVVHRVRRQAQVKPGELEAVCIGLAGVDRPQVYRPLFNWLRRSIPARFHYLTSDAAIALQAAIGDSPGIMVISGTGSIGYGRDAKGRVLRSGGWGSMFDDLGAGYDLGRKAIVAALRACDGRGPHTMLESSICGALGLEDISEVIMRALAPHEIAALFPVVLEAASRRDFVARQLCEEAGRDLADLALSLLKRLRWRDQKVPVACSGGVLQSSARIRRSLQRHLQRRAPRAQIIFLRRPAVEGALALARKLSGEAGS